ncbi:MAG: DUF805 domain-containing protein [Pseudomonadota bacterium]
MSSDVQLVFRGEVLAGFQPEEVQRELGRLLKVDEAKLAALFSGGRAVLKRGLPSADAPRYVARLAALGARVHVEPMAAGAPAPAAPPAATPATPPAAGAWPTLAPPPQDERSASPPPARSTLPPSPPPRPPAVSPANETPALATAAQAAAAVSRELALEPIATVEEVTCPTCGERQSKRLLCRACATNIEMGIAAKLEEQERRRAERQAELEARMQRRQGGSAGTDDGRERSAWPIGLSFAGRVGRLSAVNANLWLMTALFLLSVGFLQRPSFPRMLLLGTGVLAVFFFSMRLAVLRCHDCDRHGWWALFVLVPYAGNLASLLIAFLPGNAEANEYGPPPPKARWRGFFVALAVLVASVALLVRATIGFVEREAAKESDDNPFAEEAGSADTGGEFDFGEPGLNEAFREYSMAAGHKAFAVSGRKTYGWAAKAGSMQDAARSAWSECQARREPYTPDCRIVNVNGQWARER